MLKHKSLIYNLILICILFTAGIASAEGTIKGVHILIHDFDKVKAALDKIHSLGINTVILHNKHFFDLDDDFYREKVKDIFNYAQSLGMELIPELQSFGAAEYILKKYPQAAEGISAQDEEFKFVKDAALPVIPAEIKIKNSGFEQGKAGWVFGKDWQLDIDCHSGKYAAKIDFIGNAKRRSSMLKSAEYKAKGNSIYSLQFYARSQINAGSPPAVRVVELTRDSRWITQHFLYINSEEWQYKELNFKTSRQCEKLYIYANVWEGSARAWLDDIRLLRLDSALINIIISDQVKPVIVSSDTKEIFRENEDYGITGPQLSFPYPGNSAPFKISRIPGGKIKNGQRVRVSYDYVVRLVSFADWSIPYCPFEPQTYAVMEKTIKNVIEMLNPDFISLGHDEIRGLNRDMRCRRQHMSNAEVLAYDINRLDAIIKKYSKTTRMLVWDDMFNPWHNAKKDYQLEFGGVQGETASALDKIYKDVIFLIWWGDDKDWLSKMKNSPDFFEKKGFDYFVVGSKTKKNLKGWSGIVKNKKRCLGIFTTTWDGIENNIQALDFLAKE